MIFANLEWFANFIQLKFTRMGHSNLRIFFNEFPQNTYSQKLDPPNIGIANIRTCVVHTRGFCTFSYSIQLKFTRMGHSNLRNFLNEFLQNTYSRKLDPRNIGIANIHTCVVHARGFCTLVLFINPRRAFAARVTVIVLCVSICGSVDSYLPTTGNEAADEGFQRL